MKSLKDFLFEAAKDSKEFVFAFKGLEKGEETVKSFNDVFGCTVDEEGQTVTIEVNVENATKLDTAQDILQQYAQTIRRSTKNASDEQYAQKTRAFAEKVADFNEAIDEFANPDEDDADKKEEE